MCNGGITKIQVLSNDFEEIRYINEGHGISKDRLRTIGKPYYSTKEKGTELGLFISNKIVQEHGGMFDITSAPNQGTTIGVILPVKNSLWY